MQLARIMLPLLTLVALAAAFMGMLNSLHHFFIPALSPAMFNVADDRLRVRARAADAGVRPRADHGDRDRHAARRRRAARAAVADAAPRGLPLSPELDWRDPGLRRVLLLMGPGTVGLAATQVNVFVNTLLATGTGPARCRG